MLFCDSAQHRLTRFAFAVIAALAVVVAPGWARTFPQDDFQKPLPSSSDPQGVGDQQTSRVDELGAEDAADPTPARRRETQRLTVGFDLSAAERGIGLELDLARAEAELLKAQAELAQREAELEQALARKAERDALLRLKEVEHERIGRLAKSAVATSGELNEAKYELAAARAGVQQMQAAVKVAEARLAAQRSIVQVARMSWETAKSQLRQLDKPVDAAGSAGRLKRNPAADPTSGTILLSRSNYELPEVKAKALLQLFQEHAPRQIEARLNDTGEARGGAAILTITTSPQDQQIIGQFIRLMGGDVKPSQPEGAGAGSAARR